ncbi:hypothetical protein [Nocardia niwae]|uniref:hypothetical protein n=1 Tax=Nocardia niwae TaxID=626084 RepID=UPI0033FF880D
MPIASPTALRLALSVRDLLTIHPSLHETNLWIARAGHSVVGCIGGWTALLDGAHPHPATRSPWQTGYMFDSVIGPSGAPILIRDYTTARLGLTREERDQLLSEPETATDALTYLNTLIASTPRPLRCPTTATARAARAHQPAAVELPATSRTPRPRHQPIREFPRPHRFATGTRSGAPQHL